MANVQIEIKNGNKILQAFKKAPEIMARRLQISIQKLGGYTTGEVKKHITMGTDMWKPPIKTGLMRRGIQVRQTGPLKVIIAASDITPYAQFVHNGTRYMKARPFFEITARKSAKDIEKFFLNEIENAVSQIIKQT